MPTTTNVKQVKVNVMTEEQYTSATKNPNEFYAVTDAALSYNDLVDKPTIGDATLTIQKNGTTIDTFTANSTSDKTINVTVPTDTNELSNGAGYITSSALSNYVTLNTNQTITGQKTFQYTETAFQDSIARFVSTYQSSNQGWRGRVIIGAKDYTFIIGTYNGMAAIGGHKFTDSSTEEGATWSDIYFQPDGDKSIYFGGWNWTQNSGWLKVKNNASNTGGKVQVNTGTISSANWKDVAYKGENVSDFNNDANYITSASIGNATLKIQKNGTDVATFTANSSTDATANITVPTDTNDLTNGAGFITSSALSGYATETWVSQQGYLTSSDVVAYTAQEVETLWGNL